MAANYRELISECDALLKAGALAAVKKRLSKLNLAQVPREARLDLAKICRRAGLISQGLRLLQPLIRHERSLDGPAGDGEICEYAALLSRNGSVAEAEALLRPIEAGRRPDALLYLGFCHVLTWSYAEAASCFEAYLRLPVPDYSKLIARVNLAAACLATGREAAALTNETLEQALSAGAGRLAGNVLEIRAQIHIQNGDFEKARADLASASGIFGGARGYDTLLIRKWRSVLASLESGRAGPLKRFRACAVRARHWESVREADLFRLKVEPEAELFDHLYFGSPMPEYRRRLHRLLGMVPGAEYLWGRKPGAVLDLAMLKPGQIVHRTLSALTRDFYVSRNTGTLFADLYPGEYFDPYSSPLRVRQALKRSRDWLRARGLPLSVDSDPGGYRLSFQGPLALRIGAEPAPEWPERSFSADELCRRLKISRSTGLRLCAQAIAQGKLTKINRGRSTKYRKKREA
jgi:tetratricopeptide (TPR) repeat protein